MSVVTKTLEMLEAASGMIPIADKFVGGAAKVALVGCKMVQVSILTFY